MYQNQQESLLKLQISGPHPRDTVGLGQSIRLNFPQVMLLTLVCGYTLNSIALFTNEQCVLRPKGESLAYPGKYVVTLVLIRLPEI